MRTTIVATVVARFLMIGLTTGFLGCKSAPKMPWSKTAATSDVEAAAMAHSAPTLPADIAKQAESLATTTPSIDLTAPPVSSGQAAPYSAAPAYAPPAASLANVRVPSQGSGAKAAPTAYPSTGASPYASPYASTPAPVVAAATPSVPPAYQSTDLSADLGSVDMPYNPNAVPPARTVATAAPVTPNVTADRYGTSTVASTAPAYGGATVPQINGSGRYGGDRYGNSQGTTTASVAPAAVAPAASPVPPASVNLASTDSAAPSSTNAAPTYGGSPVNSAPATTVGGNRYAMTPTVTPTAPRVTQETPAATAPVTADPVLASASVYRPGGTTSYNGAASGLPVTEIATRPQPVDVQVPNVTAPGATPEPSQAPRYR